MLRSLCTNKTSGSFLKYNEGMLNLSYHKYLKIARSTHWVSSCRIIFWKWGCFRVINSLWFWLIQDDVIKLIFSASLALCEGNPPAPVEFHYKGQWRRILMFTLICARTNDWANNRNAGDLRRHRAHHDVTVMLPATVESSHIRIIYHKIFKIDSP